MYSKAIEMLRLPSKLEKYMLDQEDKKISEDKIESLVFFSKTPGTGKTYQALSIISDYIKNNIDKIVYDTEFGTKSIHGELLPLFMTQKKITEFVDVIKTDSRSELAYSGRRMLESCKTRQVLVIDDLWAESSTDFRESNIRQELYDIVDSRYNNGLITIITTNISPQEVAEFYGDRVLSRINGMCKWINVKGEDKRIK